MQNRKMNDYINYVPSEIANIQEFVKKFFRAAENLRGRRIFD